MEHFGHLAIILALIFLTLIYINRHHLSKRLLLIILLIGLSFHNLFLHFDHQVYELLAESVHECCILPAVVISDDVSLVADIFVPENREEYHLSPVVTEYILFKYSRPPPFS